MHIRLMSPTSRAPTADQHLCADLALHHLHRGCCCFHHCFWLRSVDSHTAPHSTLLITQTAGVERLRSRCSIHVASYQLATPQGELHFI